MQQSTDHLSNVMAKLVMGSAVKATLRKCEEQWRRDGTFHEEDIQQKLQMLEAASIVQPSCRCRKHCGCFTTVLLCVVAALAQVSQAAACGSPRKRFAS